MLEVSDFFDLNEFEHSEIFHNCKYPWEAIPLIGQYILKYSITNKKKTLSKFILKNAFLDNDENIFIGEGTVVEPGAFIQGPAIIGKNCQVRSGAYIRGNVVIGDNCIIGHTSELKNVIMLNNSQAPHFNYCGDSILGNNVNLGCGTILSNLPLTSKKDLDTGVRTSIKLEIEGNTIDTKLQKFGAIIGDRTQTGCNCVLNPGVLIGKNTIVYPMTSVKKAYYGHNKIIKLRQDVEVNNKRF